MSSLIRGSKIDFCYCQAVTDLCMWYAVSDERMGLSFAATAGHCQWNHSSVQVLQDSLPHFTVSKWDTPNLQGHVPELVSPKDRLAQLYLLTLGSLFSDSYDSQVLEPTSTWAVNSQCTMGSLCSLGMVGIENTYPNSSFTVASQSYWHRLHRENCFPFTPLVHVMKLLHSDGCFCRTIC